MWTIPLKYWGIRMFKELYRKLQSYDIIDYMTIAWCITFLSVIIVGITNKYM